MARLSQAFLSSLGRPAMTQSLFDLGTAIGNVPSQYQEKKKRDAYDALMTKGQEALASEEPVAISQVAQQLSAAGHHEEAQQFSRAAQQAKMKADRIAAAQGLTSRDPSGIRDAAQKFFEQGDVKAGVEALDLADQRQLQKGMAALAKYSGMEGIDLENPKAKEGFFRIASVYEIPIDKAQKFYEDQTGLGDGSSFGSETILKDSEGNRFRERVEYNKGGGYRRTLVPMAGNVSKTPVGDVQIVSNTTDISGWDKPRISGDTKTEQDFSEMRVEAVANMGLIRRSLSRAKRAREIVDQIKTGGPWNAVVDAVQQSFGVRPKTKAEFMVYAGQQVLDGLKNFKGAISDPEREYLMSLMQNLEKGGGENEAYLEELIDHLDYVLADAQLKAQSRDFSEYAAAVKDIDWREKRYAFDKDPEAGGDAEPEKDAPTFDFSDLKK